MRQTAILCVGVAAVVWVAATWMNQKGRFQVVSTTHDYFSVLLVDTASGESWTFCMIEDEDKSGDKVKSWCVVPRTTNVGVLIQPSPKPPQQ